MLEANAINFKVSLLELALEFGITGDIEIDNGHSFTYQIQVFFPGHFVKLIQKFDLYDSYPQTEEEMNMPESQKIAKLKEMKGDTDSTSKLDILSLEQKLTGDISKDTRMQIDTKTKLRSSFWLPYLCFDP